MICKERSIGLPWFNKNTNHDCILLSKQGRPHPTDIFNWTCFWNFREGTALLISVLASACGSFSTSARGTQRTVAWPPRGTRTPFEWLRNKSCKRLGSRPKRSIKPCYTNRKSKKACMWTRLRTNLLQLGHRASFAKFTRWIMKTRHSKYSFALSIHSNVRTKP